MELYSFFRESEKVIKNELNEREYKCYPTYKKPPVIDEHKKIHVRWTEVHKHWTEND